MTKWTVAALAALLLAGCGESKEEQEARMQEAREIAALSQDADQHLDGFAGAVAELMQRDDCSAQVMRAGGGFWRSTGNDYYFLYCGEPLNKSRRWYYSPSTDTLTRISSEL